MVLSRWGRRSTYMRRDTGEEGRREFSSKMPRIMSNLPDFPRRPFLYAHLCVYTQIQIHSFLFRIDSYSISYSDNYIYVYFTQFKGHVSANLCVVFLA